MDREERPMNYTAPVPWIDVRYDDVATLRPHIHSRQDIDAMAEDVAHGRVRSDAPGLARILPLASRRSLKWSRYRNGQASC